MTDDMIKALAAKGGTIQINFDCGYLSPALQRRLQAPHG